MMRATIPFGPFGVLALASLTLSACTAETDPLAGLPPTAMAEPAPAGSLSGEVEVRIVDHFDGTSERSYHLNVPGQSRPLRLAFADDPGLVPGTQLSVWGSSEDSGQLRVVGWKTLRVPEETAGFETDQRALIGAPAFPKRKLAFVLVDLGGGVNITNEEAKRKAFGMAPGDQSIKQVVLEYSAGRQDIEGEVLGPFKTTMAGCDEDGVAARLKPMIPAGFDNIVWYLGQRQSSCGWAGVAPLGRVGRIAGQLWVNGTASCRVATHEFGHNLGLQHAARLRCMGAAMADDLTKCTSSEYGDSADVMGDGCNHFNGYSKAYLNWFEKCNGVAAKSSGTFTLLPMATACDGTQVLFVPMPKMRRMGGTDLQNYALELRAPIGLDARFMMPTVLVRLAAPISQMRGARMTWIVDTNPATPTIDGLKQGETFMDPAGGVSFTVESISATSATVKVEVAGGMGGATCLDGTPFTPPGSLACANGAAPAPAPTPSPSDGGVADASPAPPPTPGTGGRSGGSGGAAGSGTSEGGGGKPAGSGGRPGSGGGSAPASSGGAPGASAPPAMVPAEGCACDVGGGKRPPMPLAFGLLLGALALLRRRR